MGSQAVVFITGASSGIGKATAILLAEKGFTVVGTSRNPDRCKDFSFPLVQMELTNPESIQNAVNQVTEKHGRIDVLINNAGVGISGPLEELPIEAVKNLFDTNLYGPIEVIKCVLPHMRHQNTGRIVNITSIAGYSGLPFRSMYSASKSALDRATESLRLEMKGSGIQCCTIAPGAVATNIAQGRFHAPVLENSPYKATYGKSLEVMNTHVDHGVSTRIVAEKIHKVLCKRNVKTHYTVGSWLQRFSVHLKSVLPQRWYEYMLAKFYNL
ncbi:MAG: SDR family oxidoreductase [Flavobacteriaceae bacterium]|jgi:NAD(P)-dependent dehydrogenase (short-subunit alcohol dehydrogenase family)|nr:SDR family oxidoreductase [Flavobacteriaceae bacterium]